MKLRLVGPWLDSTEGRKTIKPRGAAALRKLAETLKQATGDHATAKVSIAKVNVRELGDALDRIAGGEDARHVFGQVGTRGRQNARHKQQAIALAYFIERGRGASQDEAVAAVQARFTGTKQSILKTVQHHKQLIDLLPDCDELRDIDPALLRKRMRLFQQIRKRSARRAFDGT